MTWVFGIDAAFSRIPRVAFEEMARWPMPVVVFMQNLWTGGYANNAALQAVAEANLRDAEDSGLAVAGYANASPWFPPSQCLLETVHNAGAVWPRLVVVAEDVEIKDEQGNVLTEAQVRDFGDLLVQAGKKAPVYTARWYWRDLLGDPQWSWVKARGLHNAWYDSDQDIDFPANPYGPWAPEDLVGEQHQGTTEWTVAGATFAVDLNVFWLEFFQPKEEEDMKLLQGVPSGEVYVVGESGRRYIDDPPEQAAYAAVGWEVTQVPDAQLAAIPRVGEVMKAAVDKSIKDALAALPVTTGASKADILQAALSVTAAVKAMFNAAKISTS